MGSGFNKDVNVDLYYELKKPFYYAGEWVEGIAYMVAKANIFYNALYIRIEGHQHTRWSEGSGKHRRHYAGNRKTYEEEFMISKSQNGFAAGHYSFPFTFQLPAEMSGSYLVNGNENFFIRYPLQVRLVDFKGKNDPQIYEYSLTVLQPPRMNIHSLQGTKTSNPQVCCCSDQGMTTLHVDFEKNVANSGDALNLNIGVDNTSCKADIKRVTVNLTKHLFAESNGGHSRNWTTCLNTATTPPVRAGSRNTMPLAIQIPNIVNPTAIGNILANYFTVDVESEVEGCICCCGDNHPNVQAHLMIMTPTPEVLKKPQMAPPPNWNPTVGPLVVYNSTKPFMYARNPKLARTQNRQEYP